MADLTTPVLIVGGGAAGSAVAIELGLRGVECMVVEEGNGDVNTPKTGHISARTMEHCRRWGIIDQVYNAGFPKDFPMDTVLCTSLTGFEIHREPTPSIHESRPLPTSPVNRTRCPQWYFDPLLRRTAASYESVDFRYQWRLDRFSQRADGAYCAEVTDLTNDERHTVECRYLVGADGANSDVRRQLAIDVVGNPFLGYDLSILFRCEKFLEYHDKGPAERYTFIGPEGWRGNITVVDGKGFWRLHPGGQLEHYDLDTLDVDGMIYRAFGRRDVEFEVTLVAPWQVTELVAERLSQDNVFLVGDAAHTLSPTGGFGMNTAIDDSVNLGWKLAATVQGWGGAGLAESYGPERRPIGVRNSKAGTDNFQRWKAVEGFANILEDSPRGERERDEAATAFRTVARRIQKSEGIILGYRYENSPICVKDGTAPPPDNYETYVPTSRPGSRAPHAWLHDGRSTLDLFGDGFVVMSSEEREAEARLLQQSAERLRVPLTAIGLPPEAKGAYDRDLVMVRPDGIVAYAGTPHANGSDVAQRILETVVGRA